MLDRPQLALRFRRRNEELLDDDRNHRYDSDLHDSCDSQQPGERSPAISLRPPHCGETCSNGGQRSEKEPWSRDVALGETGAIESTDAIRCDRRSRHDDVMERLHRQQAGSEHRNVRLRHSSRAALGRQPQRPGRNMTEHCDGQGEQEELAQKRTRRSQEREFEQVIAEVTTGDGDLDPEIVSLPEEHPGLPTIGGCESDAQAEEDGDTDQQPSVRWPHSFVVALHESTRRLGLQTSQPQDEPHGRAENCRREQADTHQQLQLGDEPDTPDVGIGHRVVPPSVEDDPSNPARCIERHRECCHRPENDVERPATTLEEGHQSES